MSRVSLSTAALLSLTTMLLASGCGEEPTGPANPGSISLLIVSGDGQSGIVGSELPQALVIKATRSNGSVIAGLTVSFRVTGGGGTMFAGVAVTDGKGLAADYWTLGTSTAEQQMVEVRAVSSAGIKQVFGVFTATALPAPPAQIAAHAGDNQTTPAGTAVPIPPSVIVKDQYGNPVPSVTVNFAPALGGGTVTDGTSSTNVGGLATVGSWTLGCGNNGTNTLTATAGSGIAGDPVTFTASASNCWVTKAPMPTRSATLGAAAIDGILYAVGGFNNSTGNLGTLQAYDPATDTWTTKASMPTPRQGVAVAAINGILYAVGGYNNGFLTTVEAYDPVTNAWTTKASMPTGRAYHGVAAINGLLYAVGGNGSGAGQVVEAYDPATDTWTPKASMPTARSEPGVVAINGILYAVGGVSSGSLTTLEAYDPVTDQWVTKASMPTARSSLGVTASNGILHAVGGFNGTNLTTHEAYDPATNAWIAKASMPVGRSSLAVTAINGIVYAVGGYDGNSQVATVEAYQP